MSYWTSVSGLANNDDRIIVEKNKSCQGMKEDGVDGIIL